MNGEEGFSGCGPGAHKGPGDDLFNLEDATQPCQELAETGSATFGRRQGSLLPPRAAPPRPEDSHKPATQTGIDRKISGIFRLAHWIQPSWGV